MRGMILRNTLIAAALALSACSSGDEGGAANKDADPLAGLQITTARAQAAEGVPLATVPGTVTLPPEARVAVTSTYPGAALRVFVIEGQPVSRGQPLAIVRAAEPVQIGGDLARAQAEYTVAEQRSKRLAQLASEGIVAQARAEEAAALARSAGATVAENRRLAAMSGIGRDGTMTLRAPISGRVAHVGVETGGPVDGLTAPFIIENASAYRLDLQLPERLARQVRPGMAVDVSLPGSDGPVAAGKILSVAPSIDPQTRSVMAKASIGAAPGLVAGSNVTVAIRDMGMATGIGVPAGAVVKLGNKDVVFVRTGKTFAPRPVTVAATAGGQAVLVAGLKAGEVVATSSLPELKAMAAE
ncbi:efflux RND transporter periplasmic adaptor subunit [Croceibacterium aestuarii]|uniref:efflux RND transporter periplasmic adaptor subunit n=1 Tax=Croceibacterium aestuarii TaxID=3064139 RepID=UPI00272ED702|nr:efflux RND transporter periplasmic adaptor subunit [Croceibacterium sp. D39]